MSLVEHLKREGFTQIKLTKNAVGHFETKGLLNGREISVLVDTGAAGTIFSLDLAREMTLATTKLPGFGGGAGGAQLEVFEIESADFSFPGFPSPRIEKMMAMDFTHINQALEMKEASITDAIIGVDILESHSAVIDYGSSSLFLKN